MAKRKGVPDALDDMLGGAPTPDSSSIASPPEDTEDRRPHTIQVRLPYSEFLKAKARFAADGLSFSAGVRNLLARYVRGEL